MTAPGEDPGNLHLKRLQKNCEVTLERYMAVATDTCKTASRLRQLPLSKDKRLEILIQKKREDAAREAYQKARDALLSTLESDPEAAMKEKLRTEPDREYGKPRPGAQGRKAG